MGKDLNRQLSKEDSREQISIGEDVLHQIMLLENCKLKQQCDTATQLLELPQSKILTTPNTDKYVKQALLHCW